MSNFTKFPYSEYYPQPQMIDLPKHQYPGAPNSSNVMTDQLAKQVEAEWKKVFPDASILPVIGFPSKSGGVMTLTHGTGGHKMKINGLTSSSPLANNALYSSEIANGKWLNLYEIMIPDIPGNRNNESSGEVYEKVLERLGISIAGDHYHWKGSEPTMLAIHSQNVGMNPLEFTRRQLAALTTVKQKFNL